MLGNAPKSAMGWKIALPLLVVSAGVVGFLSFGVPETEQGCGGAESVEESSAAVTASFGQTTAVSKVSDGHVRARLFDAKTQALLAELDQDLSTGEAFLTRGDERIPFAAEQRLNATHANTIVHNAWLAMGVDENPSGDSPYKCAKASSTAGTCHASDCVCPRSTDGCCSGANYCVVCKNGDSCVSCGGISQ